MSVPSRFVFAAIAAVAAIALDAGAQAPAAAPATYRGRLLGVFNAQTGDPVEGAEVIDMLNKTKALTTATGTVTLAFLPDGGGMVQVQKIGFAPYANVIAISEADTLPVTVMLSPIAQTLAPVVTTSTHVYRSPALREFEARRLAGHGKFIPEEQLRKNDSRTMTDLIRQMGVMVQCAKTTSACYAVSTRQNSRYAIRGGGACSFDVYIDGQRVTDERRNLEKLFVNEMGGVESYAGPASIPTQYNMTGSACGVLLFWSRER
jgi:hypothetical protein